MFMMALGLFPANRVWPSSYFGSPVEDGYRAEYVLLYEKRCREVGLDALVEWSDGALCRRGGR